MLSRTETDAFLRATEELVLAALQEASGGQQRWCDSKRIAKALPDWFQQTFQTDAKRQFLAFILNRLRADNRIGFRNHQGHRRGEYYRATNLLDAIALTAVETNTGGP